MVRAFIISKYLPKPLQISFSSYHVLAGNIRSQIFVFVRSTNTRYIWLVFEKVVEPIRCVFAYKTAIKM